MLIFVGFLILICVGSFLVLMTKGIILAGQGRSIPSVVFNQEMFTEPEPVIADMPKRAVADSHWFVKTFMRPRRKKV
ncbi:hypothetical protein QH639_04970 [Lysinibacillus sp. 1 U-2021]|uniref:hypothetical protein n=1 Tax=Lysinibacillus sp. 1 U-2021 TaxID=3039426 RepID=UPI0024802ECE|nr:hypothetical protein [Lysinibacillus sp. 1 U-2021]WGT40137.1 hypothetical protein QH639_04970 [Lysinibacillus sp. 1 U-2021]